MVTIKSMIAEECHFYALTSDIWSSRTSEAYILLMIHYLAREFALKVITLRCAPFSSDVRHTGTEIARIIKGSYVYTQEGRSAFANGSKTVHISREQWFLLQNVCKLLIPFDSATNILSGEKYPTWSLTFPVLREIKIELMQFEEVGGVPHADWYESAKDTSEMTY